MPSSFSPRRHALWLALFAPVVAPAVAQDTNRAAELELPSVTVIGTTPLPGIGVPKERFPGNVQGATVEDIRNRQATNLPDLLNAALPSVNVNDVQGNPFQPDVSYRGFTASPLLGLPQGLSVFQDGVRLNEPFGDVVNWGLIPMNAISTINLIPGSNPLFGLNTLGGALSLRTKSGFQFPHTVFEVQGGSWGRQQTSFEHGGYKDNVDYYIAGNFFREDGWRDFSPSRVGNFFAKSGWQNGTTDFDVSVTLGTTDLIGNGVVPQLFYNQGRERIFTVPDRTQNRLAMINFSGSHWLNDTSLVSGNLYLRQTSTRTLNGDANDEFEGGVFDGETGANGGAGFNQETGANNRTRTQGRSIGGQIQYQHLSERNQFTGGASFDAGRADFSQTQSLGVFDADRRVLETTPDTVGNLLYGRTQTNSLFVTDTWTFLPNWHLTASGRYNYTQVNNQDKLNPNTLPNLNGDFTYVKFNPALGLNWTPLPKTTVFISANQGNRAPSPIELGCADPANPCTLPNAMAADPYLKQVVARTGEVGARGMLTESIGYSTAAWQTANFDDILFLSTSTSAGYFSNFGQTRRRGVELTLFGSFGRLSVNGNFTFVDATYQSEATILAENNSSRGFGAVNADDEIHIRKGDRIPGIPRHQLRINADWRITDDWSIGGTVIAMSGVYARGNENNRHQAGTFTEPFGGGTRTFDGPGKTEAFAVLNLVSRYRVTSQWEVFGRINNVFDTRYETAAILAENPFTGGGVFQTNSDDWSRQTFYGPGAPRAAWVGVRYFLERQPRR
ncbi:MAG: TonB-dependent receptor [Burkholderiales bacterium]|nr:TonB-dependent receptor [Burkholderiales bacterium]